VPGLANRKDLSDTPGPIRNGRPFAPEAKSQVLSFRISVVYIVGKYHWVLLEGSDRRISWGGCGGKKTTWISLRKCVNKSAPTYLEAAICPPPKMLLRRADRAAVRPP